MARKSLTSMHDYEGRLALLLCKSLIHVLVEQGVLKKKKALEAIDTVAELVGEADGLAGSKLDGARGRSGLEVRAAQHLLQSMRASFEVKSRT